MASPLGLRFWGTRGLVSSPGMETSKYGGNTSCAQVLNADNLVVIDAGFGIANLGEQLSEQDLTKPVHILFTHMHWDHIQGLPFFHPIYSPKTEMHLYSPLPRVQLRESLDILFDGSYSPFQGIDNMPANINFHQLTETLELPGNLMISFTQVNHGYEHNHHGKTWGYRFTCLDHSIAFISDHEAEPSTLNKPVVDFCKGVDLLVHDAQYTESEYRMHRGWGHSTSLMAVRNAKESRASELLMTHHDPSRTDLELDQMLQQLRQDHIRIGYAMEGRDYWVVKHNIKKDAS